MGGFEGEVVVRVLGLEGGGGGEGEGGGSGEGERGRREGTERSCELVTDEMLTQATRKRRTHRPL